MVQTKKGPRCRCGLAYEWMWVWFCFNECACASKHWTEKEQKQEFGWRVSVLPIPAFHLCITSTE